MHDGYGYLMQEFGIDIAGVVEPAHGLVPSAQELATWSTCSSARRSASCSARRAFPQPLLKVLRDEGARARLHHQPHRLRRSTRADKFEVEMQKNVDAMVQALVTDRRQ